MTNLFEALRTYAEETRIPALLLIEEYTENMAYSEEHLNWLKGHLDEEENRHLDRCIGMGQAAYGAYADAVFRVGLSIGLELGRF